MNIMIYPDVCICRHVMTYIYIYKYRYRTYFYILRMHHAFLLRHPAPHRAALAADAKPSVVIGCGEPRCARNDDAAEAVQNVPRTEGLSLVWSWDCCGFGEDFQMIFSGHFGRTSAKHGFGSSSFRIKWPFHDMWHPREDSGSCLSTWQPQVCHWDADVVEIGSLPFFCKWNWHLNGSMFWTWDLLRPQSPVLHSFATPG